jgi:O-antigen ligase
MVVWNKQQLINKKTVFISFLVIGVTIFSLTSNDKVVKRVNKAVIEFNVKDSLSSVATRLTMWRHGFEVFKQQPFLGYGLQNTTNVVANHIENESNEYKDSKQAEYHFKRFDHLHNEYINTLVGKGVLGLVTLLVLLLLPLAIFWRRVTVTDLSQAYFATIGIVTIIGYLIIGLTNIISTQPLLNIFFLMILAIAFIGSSTNKTI